MSKKRILTIIIILFLIGAGFIAYNFFFKKTNELATTNNTPNNPFGNFFPTENINTNTQNSPTEVSSPTEQAITKLRLISNVPVAGASIYERRASSTVATSTETVYRYVERATGHVYEMLTTEREARRISNTTIPKIYKAQFLSNKNQIAFQFLDRGEGIDTYVAEIKENKTETASEEKNILEGVFMKKNILHLLVSPDGRNLFNLVRNSDQNSSNKLLGSLSLSSNPNTEKIIFSSYMAEWIPEWVSNDIIAFNNNASHDSAGYLYFFNIKTRAFDKVLGPINGLVSKVSPDAKKVLYSFNNNSQTELRYFDYVKNTSFVVPNATIAEKCTWGSDSQKIYCAIPNNIYGRIFPDTWYMGEASFNDSLVVINVVDQTVKTLLNSSDQSTLFDMIDLKLSPKDDYAIFTNKKDLKLWSLEIK